MSTAPRTIVRAAWVVPGHAPPLRSACVAMLGDRVQAIFAKPPSGTVVDLPDSIILPALVNAHTHLELSDLPAPLEFKGQSFADWIRALLAHRQPRDASAKLAALHSGIRELHASGTALAADIATLPWEDAHLRSSPVEILSFLEWIGTFPDVAEARLAEIGAALDAHAASNLGLSPHAPYTIHFGALPKAIERATSRGRAITMHLAESLDEVEFLRSGSGPLAELLRERGMYHASAVPRGIRFADYLEILARAPRVLIIHGNFLQAPDLEILARHADRMTLVVCPRTCRRFLGALPPLREWIDRGLSVALGTDSRATSPDLSSWNEARFLAAQSTGLSPLEILEMATRRAAQALGAESIAGRLVPGSRALVCRADPAALRRPSANEALHALLEGPHHPHWLDAADNLS